MNAAQTFAQQMRHVMQGLTMTDEQIEMVFGGVRKYPSLNIDVQMTDHEAKLSQGGTTLLLCMKDSQTQLWRLL